MGVPVLTIPGNVPPSRCGLGLLTAAGLPEFIAMDQKDYIRLAIELANDRPGLISWRSRLRQHLKSSKMMDAPRFARNVETAYRQMWRTWCGVTSHPS
jgi:predicted O-linked N-acetylglucosamine transferase (SPINDLY family)